MNHTEEVQKASKELETLRKAVEAKFGKQPKSPSDFDLLSHTIWNECHLSVSSTTLKRFWGYIEANRIPSRYTINALCSYTGIKDWDRFLASLNADGEVTSGFFAEKVIYSKDLQPGDIVDARWDPQRHCQFEYLGGDRFVVSLSENAKLAAGDRFTCSVFREQQPLYLDCEHCGRNLLYVAGRNYGVLLRVLYRALPSK